MRLFSLIFLCITLSFNLQSQTVNKIAGNGTSGCDGNSGLAINAQLNAPKNIVTDAYGNKYISDFNCHVIRKVSVSGIISIVAGTGTAGNSGNDGPAVNALLNQPYSLTIDKEGKLLVSDIGNHDVRKINLATGIITLVASGFTYPYNLTCDSYNNIIVSDYSAGIKKIDHSTGVVSTILTSPNIIWAVAADSDDNFYYSSSDNKIYFYNTALSTSTLYAGTGATSYNGEGILASNININAALDMKFDNQGNLIFIDTYNYRIRKIDKSSLMVNTLVGNGIDAYSGDGGLSTNASIGRCEGIYVDECNHVFFCDLNNYVVRKSAINYLAAETPVLSAEAVCIGGTATIDISGNLNDATEWKLYSFGCGSITEGSTNGNTISIEPNASGVYYIRGEGPCVTIGVCGNINLTLANDPEFTIQPTGATICEGQTHTMSAMATGGIGVLSYQWEESINGSDWSDIIDASSSTYTSPTLTGTRYYRCRTESVGEGCDAAYSETAIIQVTSLALNNMCSQAVEIAALPYNSGLRNNHCASNDAPAGSGCSGYDHNVWFKIEGSGFLMRASTESPLTNFNTEIHVYTGTCGNMEEITCNDNFGTEEFSVAEWCSTEGLIYYISVGSRDIGGTTGNYVLSVSDFPLAAPNFSSQTHTICQGGTIALTATPGNNGDQLAWFLGECSGNEEATGSTWNCSPEISTAVYVQTRSSQCPEAASACISGYITVVNDLTITTQALGNTVCSGGSHSMTVVASGGYQALAYQWQFSLNGISYNDIPIATFSSYTIGNATQTTYYRCKVSTTGIGCEEIISAPALLNVVPDISFTLSPTGASLCSGDFHEMTVDVSGGTPSVSLQWQYSANGSVWENIEGETSSVYVCAPLSQTAYFRVLASAVGNGCQQVISSIATVFVADIQPPLPVLSLLPDINGQCDATVTATPTATDNCDGTISGTTPDELFYDEQGEFLIIWNYEDAAGNNTQQYQWVIVHDNTAPVPDMETLPIISSECYAEITDIPTATDNCSGNIQGTTTDPLAYSEQGTFYVTWRYTDAVGNFFSQYQTVIVDDNTLPSITCAENDEFDAAPNHYYAVVGSQFDPIAYSDNCAVDYIVNNFNNSASLWGALLPEGENNIEWTVSDVAGNIAVCTITVTVNEWVGIAASGSSAIKLYPNPNYGVFSIEIFDSSDSFCVKLFDVTGELLFDDQVPVNGKRAELDFSNMAKGNYLIQVESGNKVMTEKLVIE